MQKTIIIIWTLITVVLVGCAVEPEPDLPDDPPYIEGVVTLISEKPERANRILVEEIPTDPDKGAKSSIGVFQADQENETAPTRVLRKEGDRILRADETEIKVGQRVRVWTRGDIALSYPSLAAGSVVLILDESETEDR